MRLSLSLYSRKRRVSYRWLDSRGPGNQPQDFQLALAQWLDDRLGMHKSDCLCFARLFFQVKAASSYNIVRRHARTAASAITPPRQPSSIKIRIKPPGSASASASPSTCTAWFFWPSALSATAWRTITLRRSSPNPGFHLAAQWLQQRQSGSRVCLGEVDPGLNDRKIVDLRQVGGGARLPCEAARAPVRRPLGRRYTKLFC